MSGMTHIYSNIAQTISLEDVYQRVSKSQSSPFAMISPVVDTWAPRKPLLKFYNQVFIAPHYIRTPIHIAKQAGNVNSQAVVLYDMKWPSNQF